VISIDIDIAISQIIKCEEKKLMIEWDFERTGW